MYGRSDPTGAIVGLIFLVLIFLLCREILNWYWKNNEQISILKEIRDLLKSKSEKTEKPK